MGPAGFIDRPPPSPWPRCLRGRPRAIQATPRRQRPDPGGFGRCRGAAEEQEIVDPALPACFSGLPASPSTVLKTGVAFARFGVIDRSIGEPPCARRCRRTDARQRSLGRPDAAERGQRGSVLPIAGFDPCLGQASSLDLRAGPQAAAERRDPPVRLLPPRSPAWLRPDMMTRDLIPRPASSRGNRRAGAEKRSREPEAAMKRPGRRKSWPSGARPIGSRSASGGAMPAGRAGGCRESRTQGTPKECIRCLQDGQLS
jgi:hypothetical protein